ncbi:MAG TPA: hypothetical protein VFH80_11870 [Solirubrobacteraceae bacterium]|nr:hypothetical protein [Solirubrobacteraceae bacterium]
MRRVPAVLVALLGATVVLPSAAAAASSTAAATATPPATAVTPSLGGQGSNPLSPGFPQPSVSIPTTTTAAPTVAQTTSAGGGSGLTGNSAIIIAIGAIVVLGGISFYIWRDARRRAPVRAHSAGPIDEGRRAGSKARPKPRKLSPAERKRRKRGRAR